MVGSDSEPIKNLSLRTNLLYGYLRLLLLQPISVLLRVRNIRYWPVISQFLRQEYAGIKPMYISYEYRNALSWFACLHTSPSGNISRDDGRESDDPTISMLQVRAVGPLTFTCIKYR